MCPVSEPNSSSFPVGKYTFLVFVGLLVGFSWGVLTGYHYAPRGAGGCNCDRGSAARMAEAITQLQHEVRQLSREERHDERHRIGDIGSEPPAETDTPKE